MKYQSQSRSRGAGKSALSCEKRQKRQTEPPESREKVGLNHAEASEKADKIAGKSGKGRPKSCKHQKRQTKSPGSLEKVGLNHAEASEKADRATGKPGESRSKSCRSIRKGR